MMESNGERTTSRKGWLINEIVRAFVEICASE